MSVVRNPKVILHRMFTSKKLLSPECKESSPAREVKEVTAFSQFVAFLNHPTIVGVQMGQIEEELQRKKVNADMEIVTKSVQKIRFLNKEEIQKRLAQYEPDETRCLYELLLATLAPLRMYLKEEKQYAIQGDGLHAATLLLLSPMLRQELSPDAQVMLEEIENILKQQLRIAILVGDEKHIRMLIGSGAIIYPEILMNYFSACWSGSAKLDIKLVQLFLDHGANVNAGIDHVAVLEKLFYPLASQTNQKTVFEVAQLLKKSGADFSHAIKSGTIYELAEQNGYGERILELVGEGVDRGNKCFVM